MLAAQFHHTRLGPSERTTRMTSKKEPEELLNHTQYLTLVYRLGLKPCGKKTALFLGLSVRQLQRIYARQCKIPPPVARLLMLYDQILVENPRYKGHPR